VINCNAMPLVSLCIPAYNHEEYIGKTIESLIDQSYQNIELIIINDGSKDKTDKIIESHIDKCNKRFVRFVYINRENRGLPKTLNEMIGLSQGEYIKFIASDDLVPKDSIYTFIAHMLKNGLDVLYGRLLIIDEGGRVIKEIEGLIGLNELYTFDSFNVSEALKCSPTRGSAWVIRADAIRQIGCFDEISKIEDWEFILRVLVNQLNIGYISKIAAYYRIYRKSGPYFGSYLDWLMSDLYILNKYKDYDVYSYRQGVKNVFKRSLLGSRNYNNREFKKILTLMINYKFTFSIFLNIKILISLLIPSDSLFVRISKKIKEKFDVVI